MYTHIWIANAHLCVQCLLTFGRCSRSVLPQRWYWCHSEQSVKTRVSIFDFEAASGKNGFHCAELPLPAALWLSSENVPSTDLPLAVRRMVRQLPPFGEVRRDGFLHGSGCLVLWRPSSPAFGWDELAADAERRTVLCKAQILRITQRDSSLETFQGPGSAGLVRVGACRCVPCVPCPLFKLQELPSDAQRCVFEMEKLAQQESAHQLP